MIRRFAGILLLLALPLLAFASSIAVLEDFSTLRLNGNGDPLWSPYTGEDPNQTGSCCAGGFYQVVVGASPSGIYFNFVPHPYNVTGGYASEQIKSGSWDIQANRLQFWFYSSISVSRRSDGGSLLEIGTYIRDHASVEPNYQGAHYYHILDPNFYASRWHRVILNRQPQHKVGEAAATNWPLDPEFPPNGDQNVHYFDGLTRWYFDTQGTTGQFANSTWRFTAVTFDKIANEDDDEISSIVGVYTGTAYEVTWASKKNTARTFDIRHRSTTMKPSSFSSGTDGGSVSNPNSDYTGCIWTSPAMAQSSTYFVAIQKQGSSNFTEVEIPVYDPIVAKGRLSLRRR